MIQSLLVTIRTIVFTQRNGKDWTNQRLRTQMPGGAKERQRREAGGLGWWGLCWTSESQPSVKEALLQAWTGQIFQFIERLEISFF